MKHTHPFSARQTRIVATILFAISAGLSTPAQTFTQITVPDMTSGGHGGAWADYDNDGYVDLFISNYGIQTNTLFRNNGSGNFTLITSGSIAQNHGAVQTSRGAWGDFNNDGRVDLFVPSIYPDLLYTNNGNGTFTRITTGTIAQETTDSPDGAWADYDNDGWLDLFVPRFNGATNCLYHNNRDGTFTKITEGPVATDPAVQSSRCVWADFDDDLDMDLFVGRSDGGGFLYRNDGNGVFTKITTGDLVTSTGAIYGITCGDYDGDGLLDLFVAGHTSGNRLYRNLGNMMFSNVTATAIPESTGSFVCSFADYDNDGDLDLHVAGDNQASLYRNDGNGVFTKVTGSSIVGSIGVLRDSSWADYDNDGDLDLFLARVAGLNYLFRNDAATGNWLKVRCLGSTSNRSAIGAKVRVRARIGGIDVWQTREIGKYQGGSYDSIAHFGLGDAAVVDRVRIEWPSGTVQEMTLVSANRQLTINQALNETTVRANRYYYDRTDRLVGVEYANGLRIGYQYDGNGNILRQAMFQEDTNGLPVLWRFLNGLDGTNVLASLFDDADGDGWSNYQEWRAGTSPTNGASVPDVLGLAGTNLASMSWPFTPSNFVVGVGQLDGTGPDEIVIGADGDPGTNSNFLLVLSQTTAGWTPQRVDIGSFGTTSLAIGQPTNRETAAIYVGLRQPSGTGQVWEVRNIGGVWQSNRIAVSTNDAAFVVGVRGANDTLVSLAATNAPDGALYSLVFSNGWNLRAFDTNASHRGLGTIKRVSQTNEAILRLLDIGGIQYSGGTPRFQSLVGWWRAEGDASDTSGTNPGTLRNGISFAPGKYGQAFSLDGVDDYVEVPTSPSLRPQQVTLAAWWKPAVIGNQYIVGNQQDSPSAQNGYALFQRTDDPSFWFGIGSGGNTVYARDSRSVALGTWYHLTGTYDGTNVLLYVNGTLADSKSVSRSIDSTAPLLIGRQIRGIEYCKGLIDEVLLLDRVLGASEIQSLYESGPTAVLHGEAGLAISEPPATNRWPWRGYSLAFDPFTHAPGVSIFYAFVTDRNLSGRIEEGDDLIVEEFLLDGSSSTNVALSRIPITVSHAAQSYGLASLNYLNTNREVFFSGEPDGQVFAWTATGTTNPLQRQLFSAQHAGKAWHALAGVKTLESGEGLAGLRVDPARPNVCDVIFWPPQTEMWQAASVPQTAPVTRILPDISAGGGLATVAIRVMDLEGNNSWLSMQYSNASTPGWANATIASIDGAVYGAVSASPTGSTHLVVWNAGRDLGAGITNDVWLRARARDVSLTGEWSEPVPYHLEITTGNPQALDDLATTGEDTPLDIAVLGNDEVQGGAPKLIASFGQPAHGVTSTNVGGAIRYVPATNFFGPDSFVYTLSDGAGGTSMATVRITVTPVNDPPEAPPYAFTTIEDTPFTLQWNISRDFEGDSVRLKSAGPTSAHGGRITVTNNQLTYTPPQDYAGTDTFSYVVEDNGTSNGTNDPKTATGTVTVTIQPVNDPPVIAVPGPQIVAEDNSLVLTNIAVADVDAGTGLMQMTLAVTNGTLRLSSTNGITFAVGSNGAAQMVFTATLADLNAALTNLVYRGNTNLSGFDRVLLTVNDQGNTGSGGPLSDTKFIAITVNPVNDVPLVSLVQPTNNAIFLTNEVITIEANASDLDGQVLKVEFFVNANKLGEVTNTPYRFTWSNAAAGDHTIFARATDNLNATGNSDVRTVSVVTPGFVMISGPSVTNRSVRLIVSGTGPKYRIEASTNLSQWTTLSTVTNLGTQVEYLDQFSTNYDKRFYRAVLDR